MTFLAFVFLFFFLTNQDNSSFVITSFLLLLFVCVCVSNELLRLNLISTMKLIFYNHTFASSGIWLYHELTRKVMRILVSLIRKMNDSIIRMMNIEVLENVKSFDFRVWLDIRSCPSTAKHRMKGVGNCREKKKTSLL